MIYRYCHITTIMRKKTEINNNDAINKSVKSYYDIEESGMDYINNENNLNKIRSKNIRNFLIFYQHTNLSMLTEAIQNKQIIEDKDRFQFTGAKIYLVDTIYKNSKDKLTPEILERVDWKTAISQRTVYDYMNALKYLRAVDKAYRELTNAMKQELNEKWIQNILEQHKTSKTIVQTKGKNNVTKTKSTIVGGKNDGRGK